MYVRNRNCAHYIYIYARPFFGLSLIEQKSKIRLVYVTPEIIAYKQRVDG